MIKPIFAKIAFFIFASLFLIVIPFYCSAQKKDTISIIFQVSDTSQKQRYNNPVFWHRGYKVIDWSKNQIIYLEEDKKELDKKFFVWIDKPIK